MNHAEIVAAGNRASASLDFLTDLVLNPETAKEQAEQAMRHGNNVMKVLERYTAAMAADCTCGHTRNAHARTAGYLDCRECSCSEWNIDELPYPANGLPL